MTFESQRVHAFCWTKIWTLIKKKWNWKWKIPHTDLERWTLCFNSSKNHKLKVKLRWVWSSRKKKEGIFLPLTLSEGIFFNICVLSPCIVYWIHFQNIHTFPYKKSITFLLVFKIVHSLQCILKPSCPKHPKIIHCNKKQHKFFIFLLLCGTSKKFYPFKAPKRSVKIKKKSFHPLIWNWINKG